MAEIICPESVTNKSLKLQRPRFSLFLGAGASFSSNIILANQMIVHFVETIFAREQKHRGENKALKDVADEIEKYKTQIKEGNLTTRHKSALRFNIFNKKKVFLKQQNWYDEKEGEYSCFFKECYKKPIDRRNYIKTIVEAADISLSYIQLANLIERNIFRTILTTNFDDLIYLSATSYTTTRPVVFAFGGFSSETTFSDERPRVLKLHGDFLFSTLKNTYYEVNSEDFAPEQEEENLKNPTIQDIKDKLNMRQAFEQSLIEGEGIVVIGYAGLDSSIMEIFNKIPESRYLFWCVLSDDKDTEPEKNLNPEVKKLLLERRGFIVKTKGFDDVMAKICQVAEINDKEILSSAFERVKNLRKKLYKQKGAAANSSLFSKKLKKEELTEFKAEADKMFHAFAYFISGYLSYRNGYYPTAEVNYIESIRCNPDDADVHFNYGNLLSNERYDPQQAEEKYREAIKLKPDDAYPYSRLGELLLNDDSRFQEARQLISKAIELKPNYAFAYYNLAILRLQKEKKFKTRETLEKVADFFYKAAELDSTFVKPLISLISIYKHLNNKAEMEAYTEKARNSLTPEDFYNLACFNAVIDKKDEAFENLSRAVKEKPFLRRTASNDLDLEWIQDDPRFKEIVGK